MTLETLKAEIERLSPAERTQLSEWLQAQADAAWDERIPADCRAENSMR